MQISHEHISAVQNLIKSNYRKNIKLSIVLIILGAAGLIFGKPFAGGNTGIYFFGGAISTIGGVIIFILSLRNPVNHKLSVWLSTCPEEIVWIYEVSGKQSGMRFLKENGEHVLLEITGPKKSDWLHFFDRILPNAHFGYDEIGRARVKKK